MPTILIVEDNELSADMLSRRLQRKDFCVLIARDGVEGVNTAIAKLPDLILMDMSLPQLDGWEATQQLKTNATTQHIPIIGLSAHAMQGDRERGIAAGCDDYDVKPVEFARLLTKIQALLNQCNQPEAETA